MANWADTSPSSPQSVETLSYNVKQKYLTHFAKLKWRETPTGTGDLSCRACGGQVEMRCRNEGGPQQAISFAIVAHIGHQIFPGHLNACAGCPDRMFKRVAVPSAWVPAWGHVEQNAPLFPETWRESHWAFGLVHCCSITSPILTATAFWRRGWWGKPQLQALGGNERVFLEHLKSQACTMGESGDWIYTIQLVWETWTKKKDKLVLISKNSGALEWANVKLVFKDSSPTQGAWDSHRYHCPRNRWAYN